MRLFLYQIKNILRTKDTIFWSMAFPLLLGTLFYVSFGTADTDQRFSKIPVGVVWNAQDDYFSMVLKSVENELFVTKTYTEKQAREALQKETIAAYLVVDGDISMKVSGSSVETSIVETFLNEYKSARHAIETIARKHPEKMKEVILAMVSSGGSVAMRSDTEDMEDYNPYLTFFYALIAMTCLFGSYVSLDMISGLQADQSALGARKNIAPLSKMKLLFREILSTWLVQFAEILLVLFYLVGILKINFGADLYYMLLLAVIGSFFGNSLGVFVGIFVKGDSGTKNGMLTGVNIVLCFLGGLMYGNMIDIVEHQIPALNRINPAALMVHAFQSLRVYRTADIFYRNLLVILLFAVLMDMASIWVLRRKKYANI